MHALPQKSSNVSTVLVEQQDELKQLRDADVYIKATRYLD